MSEFQPHEMDSYPMGDSFRRDSVNGGLSQLRHFWQHISSFSLKGVFSFTFVFLSVPAVFPTLPAIDTKELLAVSADTIEAPLPLDQEELCRWQKDFSFFNDLSGDKKPAAEAIPCADLVPNQKIGTQGVAPAPVSVTPAKNEELSQLIETMAEGYPLEVMAPAIAEYDRDVAALIVGIAKKESNWGKRVPVDTAGKDCFNYWGFKGAGTRGMAMGHGCFGSPEEAVHAVGNRIAELVAKRQTSEPKNMIIWKCGSSCATHSPESVRKWIADVDLYYRKIAQN